MESLRTWLTNRMIEASSAASSRLVPAAPSPSSTTCRSPSSCRVPMVSAPTPRRFFSSRWTASEGASTGRSRRPVSARNPSMPAVTKSRLVAISIWLSIRRSGSSSSRNSSLAGKSDSTCLSGSSSSSRANGTPYSRASQRRTASSAGGSPAGSWRRKERASPAVSCRAAIMRSSNSGRTPLLVEAGASVSTASGQQAEHHRDRLLAHGKDGAEFLLRLGDLGLVVAPGLADPL